MLPAVEEVRPGVWSIPVPFIGNPMRYTLAYLLVGDGESALVDPGWDSDEGWEVLMAGLAAAGLRPQDITGIVVTHFHPDHLGMAARLRAASGAWVALGENEPLPPSGAGTRNSLWPRTGRNLPRGECRRNSWMRSASRRRPGRR